MALACIGACSSRGSCVTDVEVVSLDSPNLGVQTGFASYVDKRRFLLSWGGCFGWIW
ncbi:MAG: hypothetical protein QW348_04985 [Ignisphaera sp.]